MAFLHAFDLEPDEGNLAHKHFTKLQGTNIPQKKLFDHVEYYQRNENLIAVSQPYDLDALELDRWATECGVHYVLSNKWAYHYPFHAYLFIVEYKSSHTY